MASRSLAKSSSTLTLCNNPEVRNVSISNVGAAAVRCLTSPSTSFRGSPSTSFRGKPQTCTSCLAARHPFANPFSSKKQSRQQQSLCSIPNHGRDFVKQKSSAHILRRCNRRRDQITCQTHPELEKLVNINVPGANGAPDVAAFAARPAKAQSGKLPVVIMIHEFYGVTEDMIG